MAERDTYKPITALWGAYLHDLSGQWYGPHYLDGRYTGRYYGNTVLELTHKFSPTDQADKTCAKIIEGKKLSNHKTVQTKAYGRKKRRPRVTPEKTKNVCKILYRRNQKELNQRGPQFAIENAKNVQRTRLYRRKKKERSKEDHRSQTNRRNITGRNHE